MKLRIDSPIITMGIKLTNLAILNLYWIIGCLPVVTIGAATIAAYTVTLKMAEDSDDDGMTVQFWKAFVQNLKHGVPLTLLLLAGVWSIWLDWQLFDKLEGNPVGFLMIALVLIFLLVIHFLYVFPLEARYENKLLKNLSNAQVLFVRFFGRSAGLVGALFLQFLFFTQVNLTISLIGVFCMPVLMIYTVSKTAMPLFRMIESGEEAEGDVTLLSDLY